MKISKQIQGHLAATVRWSLAKGGLEIYRTPPTVTANGLSYERVYPRAVYAPWRSDSRFQQLLQTVRDHTMVDEYRLYELWTLAQQADGNILEVGVWKGGSGAVLAAGRPAATVFLCDTFRGVVKTSEADSLYTGGEHTTGREHVDRLLAILNLPNVTVLEGVFPDDTSDHITGSLGLVHVDVDAYESARGILNWAWPKLDPGGIIVFDDYGFRECDGITRLVNEEKRGLFVHNLNGHAILIKT